MQRLAKQAKELDEEMRNGAAGPIAEPNAALLTLVFNLPTGPKRTDRIGKRARRKMEAYQKRTDKQVEKMEEEV